MRHPLFGFMAALFASSLVACTGDTSEDVDVDPPSANANADVPAPAKDVAAKVKPAYAMGDVDN